MAFVCLLLQFCACSTAPLPTGTMFSSMYDKNGWLGGRCACDGQNSVLERVCTVQFLVTRAGAAFQFRISHERCWCFLGSLTSWRAFDPLYVLLEKFLEQPKIPNSSLASAKYLTRLFFYVYLQF